MIVEVEVGEEKEEIVERGGPDHMIDSRDRSSRNKSRNQNSRDKRNNSGTRYSSGLFCDHCKMKKP